MPHPPPCPMQLLRAPRKKHEDGDSRQSGTRRPTGADDDPARSTSSDPDCGCRKPMQKKASKQKQKYLQTGIRYGKVGADTLHTSSNMLRSSRGGCQRDRVVGCRQLSSKADVGSRRASSETDGCRRKPTRADHFACVAPTRSLRSWQASSSESQGTRAPPSQQRAWLRRCRTGTASW